MCHIPGIKVVMPSNAADAKGLMTAAMRDPNPVFVIMHKRCQRLRGEVPEGEHIVPIGSASVVREGRDLTIVASAYMVQEALAAADQLAEQGVEVEVVDPRSLQPLDTDTIVASVQKTHRLLTVHEAVEFAGMGRGDQCAGGGPGVRLPRCAATPVGWAVQPGAVQPTARAGVADQRRRHCPRRAWDVVQRLARSRW